MKIGPARTFEELKESGRITSDRLAESPPPLPGVLADALQMSKEDYDKNRELARQIGELMHRMKGRSADGKPLFVIGWRLYPNKDNTDYWKTNIADEHVCSCACGCACTPHP